MHNNINAQPYGLTTQSALAQYDKKTQDSAARYLMMALALLLRVPFAQADCGIQAGNAKIIFTQPLQVANLTVGADVPNGTVIYRQTYTPTQRTQVGCPAWPTTYPINFSYRYTRLPQPLSTWNGNPYPGRVYQTGVAGIGAVLWYAGNPFPTLRGGFTAPANTDFSLYNMNATYDLSLIKIGPVAPGTLQGSALPSMAIDYVTPNWPAVTWAEVNFSGAINIVAKSCTTPDVTVLLGKQDTAQFRKSGDASAWKNWSIQLTDCPRFYGTVPDGSTSTDVGIGTSGPVVKNSIQLSLQPNTPVINAAQGIIALQSGSGSGSAQGIGIQTAGPNGLPFNLASPVTYPLNSSTSTTVNISFKSRYIATANTVTPGKADATMTFTINYY